MYDYFEAGATAGGPGSGYDYIDNGDSPPGEIAPLEYGTVLRPLKRGVSSAPSAPGQAPSASYDYIDDGVSPPEGMAPLEYSIPLSLATSPVPTATGRAASVSYDYIDNSVVSEPFGT